MERLTAKRRTPRGAIPAEFSIDFIFSMPDDEVAGFFRTMNRLADYEDTGLTPEEIHAMVAKLRQIEEAYSARL